MTRQERLQEIARKLYEAKTIEKEADGVVKELRDEFFRLYDEEFRGKDYLLPVKTVEVPAEFFARTGMSQDEFISSRFPGWEVEHVEYNTALARRVFVLKRDPKYISGVIEVDDGDKKLRVSKEVSEYTPEIDWTTLKAERPDLFDKLAQPITSYEIDETEFEKLVNESPEELATLQRHMTVKQPTLRATARRVKDE